MYDKSSLNDEVAKHEVRKIKSVKSHNVSEIYKSVSGPYGNKFYLKKILYSLHFGGRPLRRKKS